MQKIAGKGIGGIMQKEFKVVEIFNPNAKNIEERLNEVFISFLTEKLVNTTVR